MKERMRMAYKGFDLSGKVALVTGGNGGIGFGMADALAQAGADVMIWGTNEGKNGEAIAKLKAHGRRAAARNSPSRILPSAVRPGLAASSPRQPRSPRVAVRRCTSTPSWA